MKRVAYLYKDPTSSKAMYEALKNSLPNLEASNKAQELLKQAHKLDALIMHCHQLSDVDKLLKVYEKTNRHLGFVLLCSHEDVYTYKQQLKKENIRILERSVSALKVLQELKSFVKQGEQTLSQSLFESLFTLQTLRFVLIKKQRLMYVNQHFLETLGVKDKKAFVSVLKKQVINTKNKTSPLESILEGSINEDTYCFIDKAGQEYYFYLEAVKIEENIADLAVFFHETKAQKHDIMHSVYLTKVEFYECFKDLCLHQVEQIHLACIKIENYAQVVLQEGHESLFKSISTLIELLLEEEHVYKLCHWDDNNVFILLQEEQKSLRAYIKHLHELLSHSLGFAYSLSISVSALDTTKDIEQSLASVEKLQHLSAGFVPDIYESSTKTALLDDKALAIAMLHKHASKKDISANLHNFFDGICIRNPVKIIRFDGTKLYLQAPKLQLLALKHEQKSILQSSMFEKDIAAKLFQVDIKNELAILTDFELLHHSPEARQYARVKPKSKVIVTLSTPTSTLVGYLFDVSIKAISMTCKSMPNISKQTKSLKIKTNLVDLNEGTSTTLEAMGELLSITKAGNEYKVVASITLQDDESQEGLLAYIYKRQKEIIQELKQRIKLF